MLHFTPLTVADVQPETHDSVSIGLHVPPALVDTFAFQPGQFLTLRTTLDRQDVRRAYSLCLTPAAYARTRTLRVAVKAVQGGRFSQFATQQLRAGDVLDVLPPDGRFTTPLAVTHHKHYVAFAGGSGITPIISLIASALAAEPLSRFTLVYGNRNLASIMFSEALEDVKNRYLGRFALYHVMSDESQEIALFHGLLNTEKCAEFLRVLIPPASIDAVFICGPEPMMDAAEAAVLNADIAPEKIHIERFGVPMPAGAPRSSASIENQTTLHIITDGSTRRVAIVVDQSVLEAGLAAGLNLPYACKAGVCCSCKAKVLVGQATMVRNFTLTQMEQAQGFVLTCQARCASAALTISFDER